MDSAIESIWTPAMRSVAMMWRAFVLFNQGRYADAYEEERKAYTLLMERSDHPRREVFTKAFLVWFFYNEGRYGESREMLESIENKYEDYTPDFPASSKVTLTMYRGLLAIKDGDLGEARSAVSAMDTLFSGAFFEANKAGVLQCRRMPHILEAEVLLAEGRPSDAIALMKAKDMMFTPKIHFAALGYYNLPTCQDVVARAWVALGNNGNAIKEYEGMITFDPSGPDRRLPVPVYHYRVALLYEKEGRNDMAARHLDRYLEYMKHADEDIFEVGDARARLKKLKSS
jgi:tetratricopeptide (TPR) repeat protein